MSKVILDRMDSYILDKVELPYIRLRFAALYKHTPAGVSRQCTKRDNLGMVSDMFGINIMVFYVDGKSLANSY